MQTLFIIEPYVKKLRIRGGFSLVELSIVLVILGLLVGFTLSGQALIRGAELRSIVTDYQRYTTAVHSFREKYFAWPGDMANATQFWGIAAGTGNDTTCYGTASTTQSTCNGNGNNRLFYSDNVADSSAPEWYRAWQHLANAGLVAGSFNGKASGAPRTATPGQNVPAGKLANSGFTFLSFDASTFSVWWSGKYDGFAFGVLSPGYETGGLILRPDELWSIDSKSDDGKPAYGMIRSHRFETNCNTTNVEATAEYNLTNTGKSCGIILAISPPGS